MRPHWLMTSKELQFVVTHKPADVAIPEFNQANRRNALLLSVLGGFLNELRPATLWYKRAPGRDVVSLVLERQLVDVSLQNEKVHKE
jgi:hypothetical protein